MVDDTDELSEKLAMWKGIDRREIEWHPTIDADVCAGCGLCYNTCGRGVFGFDKEVGVATVENPYQCKVGCTTCQAYCPSGAIAFPDQAYVGEKIREYGLVERSREKLREEFDTDAAGD